MMVREWQLRVWRAFVGVTWIPYQVAVGATVRGGEFVGLRIYFGPIKLWASWLTKENYEEIR